MTDTIRRTVRIALIDHKTNQAALAQQVGLTQSHVSDLLTGKRGGLSRGWADIFAALDLELIVRPRGAAS